MIQFKTYTAHVKVNGAVRVASTIASSEWYAKINLCNQLQVSVQDILSIN